MQFSISWTHSTPTKHLTDDFFEVVEKPGQIYFLSVFRVESD